MLDYQCHISDTISELRQYIDCDFTSLPHGMLGYEYAQIGTGGAKILSSDQRPEHHVILPGEWCEAVGLPICALIAWVNDHHGTFSRIDLAGDDFKKSKSPSFVASAISKGFMVSHCRTVYHMKGIKGNSGDTLYIGAKSSFRQLRIYDKSIESNSKIDSIRWELQLRDEAAQELVDRFLCSGYANAFETLLVELCDFRNLDDNTQTRRTRCKWFSRLVGDIKKSRVSDPVAIRTIDEIELWLSKQVAPSIVAVIAGRAGDTAIFDHLIEQGRDRLNARLRLAIESSLNSTKVYFQNDTKTP